VTIGDGKSVSVPRKPGKAVMGAPVTLGIRPEALDPVGKGDAVLTGKVFAVERLGNETYVYLEVPGSNEFAVHAAGDVVVKPGDEMKVGLAARDCHLFNSEGEAFSPSTP
jgi:multiple sugar transport system ATP-binding protein